MMLKYKCIKCDNEIEKLVKDPSEVRGVMSCLECGSFLERQLGAPSSNSTEKIDTGGNIKNINFDKERYLLAREQGDEMLKNKQKKEREE